MIEKLLLTPFLFIDSLRLVSIQLICCLKDPCLFATYYQPMFRDVDL